MKKYLIIIIIFCFIFLGSTNPYSEYDYIFTVVKFTGGDWYTSIRSVKNFIGQVQKRTDLNIAPSPKIVNILDDDFFLYPFIFIDGHDFIKFSKDEETRLKTYLINGGFLFANDDYGLYESFKKEMKKVFPDKDMVEVPFSHPIYHTKYDFPEGLPKVHEHFPGPPKGYGIFYENRLVVFFAYNSDICNGWEEEQVFHDSPEKREAAIKMGINIIYYSIMY